MRRPSRPILPVACAALFACLVLPAPAQAQLVVSATVESEYRIEGVSLTNGAPDGRIGLAYDHASGAYGGASAIVGDTAGDGVRPLGYLAYLGFAKQAPSGINWDVGVTNSGIELYLPGWPSGYSPKAVSSAQRVQKYRFDYTDLYAGASGRNLSVKLYLSPDHLGQGVTTSYVDASATVRPTSRLRLFVHAGALTPLSGGSGSFAREHFDFGPGAALELRHGEIALTWSAATPGIEYPAGYPQRRNALVLSLTGYF